jgi:cobalt/nickel transport system permease protein
VSAGHGTHGLYVDRRSPVHAARPECKVVAAIAFVFAVVAAPREAFWAFGAFAAIIAGVAALARVPLKLLARRLVIEAPFLAFAFFLPFVGQGARVDVLGVSLSTSGMWGAWNILAKGTLGVATAALLVATTPIASLLTGLDRLRVPRVMTAITGFMVRYLDVVGGELKRMNIARRSRGHDPRWFWQARAVASTAGSLFVRSFERGERVHLAMVSRGYDGRLPAPHRLATVEVGVTTWVAALALPAIAATVTAIAWLAR